MLDPEIQAHNYLNQVLTISARTISNGLARFSGWMIAGYSAILAFLLVNSKSPDTLVLPSTVTVAVLIFLLALILHIVQRYMGTIVESSAQVGDHVRQLEPPEDLDIKMIVMELTEYVLWPLRNYTKRQMAKILEGDLAASGRMLAKMTQVQGLLVIAQLVLVLTSACYLVVAR